MVVFLAGSFVLAIRRRRARRDAGRMCVVAPAPRRGSSRTDRTTPRARAASSRKRRRGTWSEADGLVHHYRPRVPRFVPPGVRG